MAIKTNISRLLLLTALVTICCAQGPINFYYLKNSPFSNASRIINLVKGSEKGLIVTPKLDEDEEPFNVVTRTHYLSNSKNLVSIKDDLLIERKSISDSEVANFCEEDNPLSFELRVFAKIPNADAVNDDPALLLIEEYLYFLNGKNVLQTYRFMQNSSNQTDFEYDEIKLVNEIKLDAPQFVSMARIYHNKETSQLIIVINGKQIFIYNIKIPDQPKLDATITSEDLSNVLVQENKTISDVKMVFSQKCFFILENADKIQLYCIDKDNLLINTRTFTIEDFLYSSRDKTKPLSIQDIWIDEDRFLVLEEIGGLYVFNISNVGSIKISSKIFIPYGRSVRLFGTTLMIISKKYNKDVYLGVFYDEYNFDNDKLALTRSIRAQMDDRFDIFFTKDFAILPQVNFIKLARHSISPQILATENSVYRLNMLNGGGLIKIHAATNNPNKNIFFMTFNQAIVIYDTRINNLTLTCLVEEDYQLGTYLFRQYFLTKTCQAKRISNDTSANSYCAFMLESLLSLKSEESIKESKDYTNIALGVGLGLGGAVLLAFIVGLIYYFKTKSLKSKYEKFINVGPGHETKTDNSAKKIEFDAEQSSVNHVDLKSSKETPKGQEKTKKSDNNRYGKTEDSIDNVYADVEGE